MHNCSVRRLRRNMIQIRELVLYTICVTWIIESTDGASAGDGNASVSSFIEEMAAIGKNCVPLPLKYDTPDCPLNGFKAAQLITKAVFKFCYFYSYNTDRKQGRNFSIDHWNYLRGFMLTAIRDHENGPGVSHDCGCCLEDNKDGKCSDEVRKRLAKKTCGNHVMRAISNTLDKTAVINSLKMQAMETTGIHLCYVHSIGRGFSFSLSDKNSIHIREKCKAPELLRSEHAVLSLCRLDAQKPGFCGFRPISWYGVGRSIKERCQGDIPIPTIPVATFRSSDRSYDGGHSGIFIRCTKTGAMVASQWCGQSFHEQHIPFADLHRYYEIGSSMELEWSGLKKYRCNPYINGPFI